jgi:hypothetical protein
VVGAGLAGKVVLLYWAQQGSQRVVSVGLGVGLAITAIFWGKHQLDLINLRPEAVLDGRVKMQLDRLPDETTILYGEMEIALLSCLLQGADRYGALAYPMLDGTPSLEALVSARKPSVLVVPAPRSLSTLAVQRMKNFTLRRHGFFLPAVDRLAIRSVNGGTMSDLHLYVRNGGSGMTMVTSVSKSARGDTGLAVERPVPEGFDGWLRVWDPRIKGATELMVSLPDEWGWIEGIATEAPEAHVRWPWKSGAVLTYHVRGKPPEKGASIQFTVDRLLGEYAATALVPLVQTSAPVISDDSGLVFLRTIFAKEGP